MDIEDQTAEPDYPRGMRRERYPQFPREVFRLNDMICVAFNNVDATNLPFNKDVLFMWPNQYKRAAYSSDEMPYVAIVLSNPRYEDSALRALHLEIDFGLDHVTAANEKGEIWRLVQGKQDVWMQMENAVYLTISVIQEYTGGFMSHLELEAPRRRPSDYGFTKNYKTKEAAFTAVKNARGAFGFLCLQLKLVAPATFWAHPNRRMGLASGMGSICR